MKTVRFDCPHCGKEVEMGGPRRPKYPRQPIKLTRRERQVMSGVADGEMYDEIAARLHIQVRTVQNTVIRVMQRLGARTRDQALAILMDAGLLEKD